MMEGTELVHDRMAGHIRIDPRHHVILSEIFQSETRGAANARRGDHARDTVALATAQWGRKEASGSGSGGRSCCSV